MMTWVAELKSHFALLDVIEKFGQWAEKVTVASKDKSLQVSRQSISMSPQRLKFEIL